MAGKMLGIDIGTDTVKMAYVKGSEVVRFIEAPLPENAVKNGRVISFNALADVIRTMRKENRIHCRRASVSVAATNNIVVRRITMPKMTEEQLMVNMPYELHDFLNSDIKDYLFDYSLISMGEKDMTLMACAIGRSTVENFRIMAKIAGIKIEKIVPDVIALQAILPAPVKIAPEQTKEKKDTVKTESGDSSEDEIIAMTPREERKAKKKAEAEAKKAAKQEAEEKKAEEKAAKKAAEKKDISGLPDHSDQTMNLDIRAGSADVLTSEPISRSEDKHSETEQTTTAAEPSGSAAELSGTSSKMPWEMSDEERKEASESVGKKPEAEEKGAAGQSISDDREMNHSTDGQQTDSHGSAVQDSVRQTSPQTNARDFVILDIGHSGTRMYFYSNYTFEITRNIDAGSDRIVDIIARNNGMDRHAALTRLTTNQPSVMSDPEVDDEVSNLVAQVMRSINFYGYNNLNNTIDRIYYMGSGIPTECYLKRLEEATEMTCEPVSDLLPEEARAEGINDGPQVYGCIVE